MPHFVVPPEAICGETVTFPPDQGHQSARVLRLRSGDEVIVRDGSGSQYCATRGPRHEGIRDAPGPGDGVP